MKRGAFWLLLVCLGSEGNGLRFLLPGVYRTEAAARRAAALVGGLTGERPPAQAGGHGPDDTPSRLFVVRPDGTSYRYQPDPDDCRSAGA